MASSLDRAKALILAGKVLVDDHPMTKAGERISPDAAVRIRGAPEDDFASRGALKLGPALDQFGISPVGAVCLDIGASTGGFTDVLLRRGAARVYAVDVGYGQLDWRLRSDPRVVVLDRTNARLLTTEEVPVLATLAVIDVSFISVTQVLAPVAALLEQGGSILAMVKPQFEVPRGDTEGGVVRDETARSESIKGVARFATGLGLVVRGQRDNDIRGPKGNLECFLHFLVDGPIHSPA